MISKAYKSLTVLSFIMIKVSRLFKAVTSL